MRNTISILTSEGFYFHEGWGYCCLSVDPKEKLVASWFIPSEGETKWYPHGLFNVKSIIWSGL